MNEKLNEVVKAFYAKSGDELTEVMVKDMNAGELWGMLNAALTAERENVAKEVRNKMLKTGGYITLGTCAVYGIIAAFTYKKVRKLAAEQDARTTYGVEDETEEETEE